jgi:hypothetical protein
MTLSKIYLKNQNLPNMQMKKATKICWQEAKVLQVYVTTTYRKYKESTYMSLVAHLISQPSLDISPIWTVIIAKVRDIQLSLV